MQAKELSSLNLISSKLSNLSLQLYGIILKSGYIKNEAESKEIKDYFNDSEMSNKIISISIFFRSKKNSLFE